MSTMNFSLPESLKDFVDDEVGARGYSTSSEYVIELIRKERDRKHLRSLLLEGANSPLSVTAGAEYFGRSRNRIRKAAQG